jgi:hypothetical protein
MESAFVSSPSSFSAFTVKLDVPAVVGVPDIMPVVSASSKPAGNVPLSILHVMGAVPVASRVWLYATPTSPSGRVVVVIVGDAVGSGAITIESAFVFSPPAFSAFTVKFDVPAAFGVPDITPVAGTRVKPPGKVPLPLTILHVMGVSPVASRVWLYAVPTSPSGKETVVMAGGTAGVVVLPSSQDTATNPINVIMATNHNVRTQIRTLARLVRCVFFIEKPPNVVIVRNIPTSSENFYVFFKNI